MIIEVLTSLNCRGPNLGKLDTLLAYPAVKALKDSIKSAGGEVLTVEYERGSVIMLLNVQHPRQVLALPGIIKVLREY